MKITTHVFLKISLYSEFWGDSPWKHIKFSLSEESRKIANRQGIRLIQRGGTCQLLGENRQSPLKNPLHLRIRAMPQDLEYMHYTLLPKLEPRKHILYSSIHLPLEENAPQTIQTECLSYVMKACTIVPEGPVKKHLQVSLNKNTVHSTLVDESQQVFLDLQNQREGKYELTWDQGPPISLVTSEDKGPFLLMFDITLSPMLLKDRIPDTTSLNYTFKSKEMYWRYIFDGDLDNNRGCKLKEAGQALVFQKEESDSNTMSFLSETPVKLRQHYPYIFQLLSQDGWVCRDRLPYPNKKYAKVQNQKGDWVMEQRITL